MAIAADHGIEYGKIFGSWQIRELIGTGSEGRTKVYRITKDAQGGLEAGEERALKAVTICEDLSLEKMTAEARADYDANRDVLCEKACNEVLVMKRLEGAAHVVGYLDWEIRDRTGGTDLLIAMHLLETLEDIQKTRDIFCETEVLQVGLDICEALVRCHEEDVLHRDIKPANIFRRPDRRGGYLLGDFGVSRIVDNGMGASTDIGTPAYAAPEQARRASGYDGRVDIYSLGVVLYELSNQNRLPFAGSRYSTKDIINRRVILGETLPVPVDASPALASVILKACAFHREDRFQTAQEFLDALEGIKTHTRPGDAEKPASELSEDPYATMPLTAFVRENPPATPPAAETAPVDMPQAEMYFGQEQAKALFTDDMLREMSWESGKSVDERSKACRGVRLAIPQGYTVIETDAFQGILRDILRIGRLYLPETVREIQKGAFHGLEVLEFIELPDSVQAVKDLPNMGSYAYVKCSKRSCARGFSKGGERYLYRTKEWLTKPYAMDLANACDGFELVIPKGYQVIEDRAFTDLSLDSTGEFQYWEMKVERVIVTDTVDFIGDSALEGLEVTDYIEVPASVKHIGKNAFNLAAGAYIKCDRSSYAYGTCKRRGIPTSAERAGTFGQKQAKKLFSKDILGDEIDLFIPEGYVTLDGSAFLEFVGKGNYLMVDHMILPKTLEIIHEKAFDGLIISGFIEIPDSVFIINDFPYLGPDAYVKCESESEAHTYCREHHIKNSVDDNV